MNVRMITSSVLAVAAWVGAGSCVRADNLDQKLLEQAPKIVEALQKQGCQNVGVVRFRAKVGSKAESFGVGAINGNLAVRLENALVIHAGSEESKALGVIHNASKTALQNKVGNWFADAAEREKLFKSNYPLAWGKKTVSPDVLLTGLVEVAGDYSKGTVTIEGFTAKDTKLTPIVEKFTFEPDVALLHDLGKSYSVARDLPAKRTVAGVRSVIFKEVRRRDDDEAKNPPEPVPQPATQTSVMVGEVEFTLLSDGNPVTMKPATEENNGKQLLLECPDVEKPVIFRIENKGTKKLGVDVKLNGASLLFGQPDDPEGCRLWVLDPAEPKYMKYDLKGFYQESQEGKKNVSPFKILVGDEAKAKREELGDKAGQILISVFDEAMEDEMLISKGVRGLKPQQEKTARTDLRSLQRSLMKVAVLKSVRKGEREIIVKDEDAEKQLIANLKEVDFKRSSAAIASVPLKIVPKPVAE